MVFTRPSRATKSRPVNTLRIAAQIERGTLTANSSNTLTVQKQLTGIDANTKIIVVGKPNASVDDIQIGNRILAWQVRSTSYAARASRILIAAPGDYTRENVHPGRVTTAHTNQITLASLRGDITANITNETQIPDTNMNAIPATELQGKNILLIGKPDGNHFQAQIILAR